MAPPNSVAVASPIPTSYFGDTFGALAAFPSAYTWHGLVQPFIPTAHDDYDSSGRTLRPWPVVPNPAPIASPAPPIEPVHVWPGFSNLRRIVNNLPQSFENPLSWWKRQLPGIPERGL